MESAKDLAIVLRVVPYEDRHKIVTALTEKHGKITLMARNAVNSRRFGSGLEVFSAGEWSFTLKPGSEVGHLSELTVRRSFEKIPEDFQHLALASLFSEIMIRVAPPWESAPELFMLYSNALAGLDTPQEPQRVLYLANVYVGKILIWSGCQPQLGRCFQCSKTLEQVLPEGTVYGSASTASWRCQGCEGTSADVAIASEAISEVWHGLNESIRQVLVRPLSGADQRVLLRWMIHVLAFHVPGFDQLPMKSLKFVI